MPLTIFLMILAMSLIPISDAIGKVLQEDYGVTALFVAWARFAIGMLIFLPLMPKQDHQIMLDWRIWLRGALIVGTIVSILTAVGMAPLADVFAAFFIGPLISFALSVWLLKERATPLHWVLVTLGFLGVLIVVRPTGSAGSGLSYAVLAGVFYGCFLTSSRWLVKLARPISLMASQVIVGTALLTPWVLDRVPDPGWEIAGLLVATGLGSATANFLLVVSYQRAAASQLAPFVYFQIVAATAVGWLVFDTLPDAWAWAGMALVVSAGLAAAMLKRPVPPPA